MPSVEFRGVRKAFGDHTVIPELDLTVQDGELMVLLGPSGCGKSTLLRLLAGLEQSSAGEIRIGGARSTPSVQARATSRWCSRTTRCTPT
jgi:multiple sugar transport system ATP-binding protein